MMILESPESETWANDIGLNAKILRGLVMASPLGILAVDTKGIIRLWNKAAEKVSGWREDEVIGQPIRVLSEKGGKKYEELRERTQKLEVFTSLPMQATKKDGTAILISYSTAPVLNADGRVIGAVAILYDITEKMELENNLKMQLEKQDRIIDETVHALATAIEKRDPYTFGHQQRVAQLAGAIALEMGCFDETSIKGITTAASIHDIGKLYVPAEILTRPGRLTNIEFELIKTHPQAGYEILQQIEFPWPIARMVQQHHERLDGSGYPAQLAGDDILLEARIIGVADMVEAMSSHRPYRPGKGQELALREIKRASGSAFDPHIVNACLEVFRKGFMLKNSDIVPCGTDNA